MNEKTTKVIGDSRVARRLCKMGNHIVDIKRNKFKNDNSSVFVFELTEKFQTDLDSIVGEKAEA